MSVLNPKPKETRKGSWCVRTTVSVNDYLSRRLEERRSELAREGADPDKLGKSDLLLNLLETMMDIDVEIAVVSSQLEAYQRQEGVKQGVAIGRLVRQALSSGGK